MPNYYNEMSQLNAMLCVFSALVTLFLLIGSVTDTDRSRPLKSYSTKNSKSSSLRSKSYKSYDEGY